MSEMHPTPPGRYSPLAGVPAPYGGNGAAPAGQEPEASFLAEYLGAVRRHLWVVLLMTAAGAGFAAYAVYWRDPMYTSKAVLQLPEERGSSGGGLAGLAASLGMGGGSMQSQIQVIRSRLLLGQVVDSLGLRLQRKVPGIVRTTMQPTSAVEWARIGEGSTVPSLDLRFGEDRVEVRAGSQRVTAAYGEPVEIDHIRFVVPRRPSQYEELTLWVVSRDDAIDGLVEATRPYAREGTSIVDVFVNGYDPDITKRLANTTVELYKSFSGKKAREQAERRRVFVFNQLQVAESLLAVTQDQLTDFRKREQLYSSRSKAMAAQTGTTELEMRRAELSAERGMYQGLLASLQRSGGRNTTEVLRTISASPTIAQNPTLGGLAEQLGRYQAARDSALAGPWGRTATNPDVQRIDSLTAATEGRLLAATRSYVELLGAQLSALDAIAARSDSTMSRLANAEPEEVRLMLRMESISEAAKNLRERYYTAGMAEAAELDQVTILDPALEGDRAGSTPGRTLLLGLIFGLMIGGAGAIALDSANRAIRRRDEMERVLHLPGLATIPQLDTGGFRLGQLRLPRLPRAGNGRGADPDGVLATQAHSLGAEAYRTLRTNLIFSRAAGSLRSVVVTSPSGAEGKTTTAANVAVTFAQQGMRVLLVDCDFYRARLHRVFGVPNTVGLADLLTGAAALEQAIRATGVERVSVIPAGPLPQANPADLLGGEAMRAVLEALAEDFDLVILDTPPVLATANAAILATQTDGVLLVVRAGQTDRDAAREALQQLATVGARVLGAVLNDPDSTLAPRKGYYEDTVLRAAAANGRGR